jgi:tetratricopeptide (TPR) repeat protein
LCHLLKNRYHNIDSKGCNLLKKQQVKATGVQFNHAFTVTLMFILFSMLFVISPYFRGLFFREDYYWVSFFIQVLLLLTIVLNIKLVKELIVSNKTLFVLLWGLVFFYTLSYWYSSSPFHASNESLLWFSYVAVFLMLWIWSTNYSPIKEWVWFICWITLIWIVGLVFLVDLGKLEFQDAVLGRRFSSVFQYPNTLASIVSAFVIAGLIAISKRVQIMYQVMYGLTVIPFMLAFLLTESRGGLLVFVLGWGFGLIFLAWKEQILYSIYTGILVGISFWGLTNYKILVADKFFFKSALLVLGLSILFATLVMVVQFIVNRRMNLFSKSKLNFILPISLASFALFAIFNLGSKAGEKIISLFPEFLQNRVASISLENNSAQTRILFYKDSLEVWKDHLWFGSGGGGWRALFESYKSLPYFSTQAHSFYMQTLIEVGLIGSIFVFGFFLYVLLKGVRTYFILDDESRKKNHLLAPALVAVTILMLHNAIDFNMSFGTYNLFLFALLAIIWSYIHKHNDSNEPVADSTFSKLKKKLPSISYKQNNRLLNGIIAIIIVSSLFSVYKSYAFAQAEGLYKQAQQGGDFQQTMDKTDKAISFSANDPKLRELRIQLLSYGYQELGSEEYNESIDEGYQDLLRLAPTHFTHYLRYAEYLWADNRGEEALEHLGKALELAPWQQLLYEENIKYRLDYALTLIQNDEKLAIENQAKVLTSVMNQLKEKLRIQTEDVPAGMHLSKRILLTNDNRQLFGKAYYYLGEFDQSLEYLLPIDLGKLEDSGKRNVLVFTLLNYKVLNNEDKLQELLNSELSKELDIEQIYHQVSVHPEWMPLKENAK